MTYPQPTELQAAVYRLLEDFFDEVCTDSVIDDIISRLPAGTTTLYGQAAIISATRAVIQQQIGIPIKRRGPAIAKTTKVKTMPPARSRWD